MNSIYLTYADLISCLGNSVDESYQAMLTNKQGIKIPVNTFLENKNWPVGAIQNFNPDNRFETLFQLTINRIKEKYSALFSSTSTLLIISSTKGNVNGQIKDPFKICRQILKSESTLKNEALILSNACISGVLSINIAADLLRSKQYKNAIIIGIDVLSDFVINGFQSLMALSSGTCKPFDEKRNGINLSEASASVILSTQPIPNQFNVFHLGGASSNDANHISGPSRTGEGLVRCVNKSLNRAQTNASSINFVSAHGTATLYNDSMECQAFYRLGINAIPTNSLKAYFGHCLGAAGVLETIISIKMMEHSQLIKSKGYTKNTIDRKLSIVEKNTFSEINTILKTSSGFGGGNASLILSKIQVND